MAKRKGWRVRAIMPEEQAPSEAYWAPREAVRYELSSSMRRMQAALTARALELAGFKKRARILDAGCGTGFSTQLLLEAGFDAVGIDAAEAMVGIAEAKGLPVYRASMDKLPFPKESFDGIVSISALQWLLIGTPQAARDAAKKVAAEWARVLKPKGTVVIQFYPKSQQIMEIVGKQFRRAGFAGQFVIDNPDNPRKRKIFLVAHKV